MTMSFNEKTQSFSIPSFTFANGNTLPSARLCYLDLNPESSKAALVITCFRGRLASTMNFTDGPLKDHRVIVVALFGNGESSSPSNSGFPNEVTYMDCVKAQKELLTFHLGIESIEVVVGFSMGGQCAYHWGVMFPDFMQKIVVICSSARTSRHNYQFLEGPKAALENAVDYVDRSLLTSSSGTSRGVHAFGKSYSAWLTSAEWFDQELYKTLGYESLESWDLEVTLKGYAGWEPDDLLVMLHMWQAGDIAKAMPAPDQSMSEKSLELALSSIKAHVLLLPCQTDQYFRPSANDREAQWIPAVTVEVIPSVWGHVAGSGASPVDREWMERVIAEFMQRPT